MVPMTRALAALEAETAERHMRNGPRSKRSLVGLPLSRPTRHAPRHRPSSRKKGIRHRRLPVKLTQPRSNLAARLTWASTSSRELTSKSISQKNFILAGRKAPISSSVFLAPSLTMTSAAAPKFFASSCLCPSSLSRKMSTGTGRTFPKRISRPPARTPPFTPTRRSRPPRFHHPTRTGGSGVSQPRRLRRRRPCSSMSSQSPPTQCQFAWQTPRTTPLPRFDFCHSTESPTGSSSV
ncbi:hypothetical protein B0H14DRAFT_1450153 [Mycena olivaceomarginata]|nr:hypothetical protein B0H14DRAFT_1450153 [Mycena olivaceomarginata]